MPPFVSFQQSLNNAYRQSKRHSGGTKLANAVLLRDTYADVNKLFDFHKEKIFTSNTNWKPSVEQKSTYLATYPVITQRSLTSAKLYKHNYVLMEEGTTKKNKDVTSKMGNFCSRRNINSNHTSVNDVLVFLTELYETGVRYFA